MANRVSRCVQDVCCKIYGLALAAFPPHARTSYANEAQVIAADYLADRFEKAGWIGLTGACFVLTRDAFTGAIVEWSKVPALWPVLFAGVAITLSNFWFGNDLAGTVYWALTVAAIAAGLGLWLRSASIAVVTLLVVVDTSAGALSVFASHRTLEPVFVDTLQWIPLAIVLIAGGSYSGAGIRRVLVKQLQ